MLKYQKGLGGAPLCRRLKDFGRHVMISESRTASPSQPAGVLDYIKDSLQLVLSPFICENEAFARIPSLVALSQLCILVYAHRMKTRSGGARGSGAHGSGASGVARGGGIQGCGDRCSGGCSRRWSPRW